MGQGEVADHRIGRQSTSDNEGDSFGFAMLYRQERPRLMRFFLRKLGNQADADDLSQETLVRFFKAAPAELVTPQAYLTRIATNLLHDHAERGSTRLAQRTTVIEDALDAIGGADPFREVDARQELVRWNEVLKELMPKTLEIFLLNRVEGYSYRQIATDLGVPLWIVQKHMARAIRHLAAHQEPTDD